MATIHPETRKQWERAEKKGVAKVPAGQMADSLLAWWRGEHGTVPRAPSSTALQALVAKIGEEGTVRLLRDLLSIVTEEGRGTAGRDYLLIATLLARLAPDIKGQ